MKSKLVLAALLFALAFIPSHLFAATCHRDGAGNMHCDDGRFLHGDGAGNMHGSDGTFYHGDGGGNYHGSDGSYMHGGGGAISGGNQSGGGNRYGNQNGGGNQYGSGQHRNDAARRAKRGQSSEARRAGREAARAQQCQSDCMVGYNACINKNYCYDRCRSQCSAARNICMSRCN